MNDRQTPARRRWPRLSVRALLGLVLVAGLVLGWWMRSVRNQRQAVATIRSFYAPAIAYDDEYYPEKPIDRLPSWLRGPVAWLDAKVPKDYFHSVVAVMVFAEPATVPKPAVAEVMAAVLTLDHLESADLGLAVRDEDLARLGRLTRLKKLVFYEPTPGLTDAGLASIAEASALELLWLPDCEATDAGLARLGALPMLERLGIGSATEVLLGRSRLRATGSGLARLSSLPKLWELKLRSSRLTHEGIAHLDSLRHLTHLELAGPVTPEDLPALNNLAGLTFLTFACSDLNGRGLETLRRLPRLEILQFFHDFIDDSALPALAEFRTLKHLDLSDTNVTPAGLASLRARRPDLGGLGKLTSDPPGSPTRPRPKAQAASPAQPGPDLGPSP